MRRAKTVAAQSVQWDAVGLPSQVTTTQSGSTKTVLYGYDSLGQVTSQCSPTSGVVCKSSSPKVTYAYDVNGNRTGETNGATSTTHAYDVDDRLVSSTAGTAVTSYAYGLNGELDSVTSPAGTVQYAYGLDGNLYNAVLADGRAVALAYDESGNRVQRTVNGSQTSKWVWDTNAALPVRTNESGTTTWRWFEDPQSSLGTAVASVSKDGEPTWLLTDFSGTTLTTAKTAGASSSAKYDPFGNVLSGSVSQPLQFHGQYKDSVLGLYDMRQRDYNPVTGMFLATDPIAVPVGDPFISRYSYGFNDPLVFTDASGLEPRAWKDGRLVGVPGVGGIPAAVAKAATKAAGTKWSGAKAGGSGTGAPPSALPSNIVDCPPSPTASAASGYFTQPATDFFSDEQLQAMESMTQSDQTKYARMWAALSATRVEFQNKYPDKSGLIGSAVNTAALNYIDEELDLEGSFEVYSLHYVMWRESYAEATKQAPAQGLAWASTAYLKTAEITWYSSSSSRAIAKGLWTAQDIRDGVDLGNILFDGYDLGEVDDFTFDFESAGR